MSAISTVYKNSTLENVFSFPNPVNEIAARIVAGMVVALSLATIFSGQSWLIFVLAYGFLARVVTGPTLSPMGQLATRVLVPALGNRSKLVAGPPKRFCLVSWADRVNASLPTPTSTPLAAISRRLERPLTTC